jgi:HEAT repeat protein
LIESLAGPDQRVLTASIRALAVFGPKAAAAISRLQELKESKDPGVKDDATQALAKIKGAR